MSTYRLPALTLHPLWAFLFPMKARLLRKLLNDTGYIISNNDSYIAVGSPMCHNLIKVTKAGLVLSYALDTFREGRASIKHPELGFIWDKLEELIQSGEINEIISGKDEIENPIPVFTVTEGKLVESKTDNFGWPNVDDDGYLMYENTHFKTAQEAIKQGIKEAKSAKEFYDRRVKEIELDKLKAMEQTALYEYRISRLELEGLLTPENNSGNGQR